MNNAISPSIASMDDLPLEQYEDRGEALVIRDSGERPWIIIGNEDGLWFAHSYWQEEEESGVFRLEAAPIAYPVNELLVSGE